MSDLIDLTFRQRNGMNLRDESKHNDSVQDSEKVEKLFLNNR